MDRKDVFEYVKKPIWNSTGISLERIPRKCGTSS